VVGAAAWRAPGVWVCVLAILVALHGMIHLTLTPYDPGLGEGDYNRVEAAFYFQLSVGVGAILFAYGCCLLWKHKRERAGSVL
jgi:hypothetical protein